MTRNNQPHTSEMEKETHILMQVSLCLVASGTMISSGMNVAFPAVAQPSLALHRDLHFWVAALPQVTMAVGCLVVGPLMDRKGRRLGLILSCLPAAIGWLMMGILGSLWSLYTGRLLTGLSMGFAGPAVSVFVSEIASPASRSSLTVAKTIAFSIGVTATYILGYFFETEWRVVAVMCGLSPLACLLLTLAFIPESEVWKTERRRPKRHWLLDLPGALSRPQVTIPMVIMNTLLFLRQMAGTSAILSFMVEILREAGVVGNKYLMAAGLGGMRVAAGVLAAWLSSRLGRRLPVAYSGVTMSAAMLYLSKLVTQPDPCLPHVPAVVLFLYILASTVFGSVPQAMIGEVFPTDVRGMSAGVTSLTMYMTSFLALWLYEKVMAVAGIKGLFLFYGVFSVLSTIMAILFLPETHGKTLKEIEFIFTKEKRSEEEVPLDSREARKLSQKDKNAQSNRNVP